jgi:hypothetical protein
MKIVASDQWFVRTRLTAAGRVALRRPYAAYLGVANGRHDDAFANLPIVLASMRDSSTKDK